MARSLTSTHGYDLDSSVVSPGVFSQSQSQSNTALPSPVLPLSKKRNVVFANLESSPASEADDADPNGERKRQPVKRACNECRQQKLRCDVVQDPFSACSRCKRLNLQCKIEVNFKRIGKRSRNAEMERELADLRQKNEELKASLRRMEEDFLARSRLMNDSTTADRRTIQDDIRPTPRVNEDSRSEWRKPEQSQRSPLNSLSQPSHQTPAFSRDGPQDTESPSAPTYEGFIPSTVPLKISNPSYNNRLSESDDAVAGLLDLRAGGSLNLARSPGPQAGYRRIGNVTLSPEAANELFNEYFKLYHPYLPFLDPSKPPDDYYNISPLLYWTVIAVGSRRSQAHPKLLTDLEVPVMKEVWGLLAEVPQSYHIVKALALLCTWPFPTSSTSTDPTVMLCGMMMHVAMQIGLHRPSHAQDFSKFKIEFREGELKDRVRTWAVCNIVAQRVSTGYGQPSTTLFDWTLSKSAAADPNYRLPREIQSKLDIEVFCAKVSTTLYGNKADPVGLSNDAERYILIKVLSQDLEDLKRVVDDDNDPITSHYLYAATLHLRLSAFFDDPSATDYQLSLTSLYSAAVRLIEASLDSTATDPLTGRTIDHTTNYLYQMTLAAGFVLFKLWKSPFAAHIDKDNTKSLFNRTIWCLRNMSVSHNDLPQRMTEVLCRMWKASTSMKESTVNGTQSAQMDTTLKLKVKCRMSMSLVYDSVWRWREEFLAKGHKLETFLKNPANPDSSDSGTSSASATTINDKNGPGYPITTASDPSLAPPQINTMAPFTLGEPKGWASPTIRPPSTMLDPYEVFDPLNWMLDGQIEFPTYPYPLF